MKIVIDDKIPYIGGVFEPYAEVVYIDGGEITSRNIKNADALVIRTRTKCNADLLTGSAVKLIVTATIGVDHIDLDYCMIHGITVADAAGCNAGGVLQWVSAVLAVLSERDGWRPEAATLGVVGVGHVGSLVARYAREWGFRVLCTDPPRERAEGLGRADDFIPLNELVELSAIVSVHVPLTRGGEFPTLGMFGRELLAALPPKAVFVNSSRGEVAADGDLKDMISTGRSCCLDTWNNEPEIDRKLLERAYVATAHIAGYSAQGKANATAMSVMNVAKFFGLPICGWYPPQVDPLPSRREISWDQMRRTIGSYCDVLSESAYLKAHPGSFEIIRNEYPYRQEYF